MGQESSQIKGNDLDKPLSLWSIIILSVYVCAVMVVVLFPAAGDWGWLEAWIFIIVFTVNMLVGFSVVNKKNPRVLRNRMQARKEGLTSATRKSAGSDIWLMPLMLVGFLGALILPALGHRFGWSALPLWLEVVGIVLMNVGVALMNIAMLQNSYASKILDIKQGQYLVDTGMYSRVRHPYYAGAVLMIMTLPIALGNLYALVPAALVVLTLVIRIIYEEDMLLKGMDGYEDYQNRVRYKLIPGIY